MPAHRTVKLVLALVLVGIVVPALAGSALANPADVSVGGVWVTRFTAPANGLAPSDRALFATRQITEVLSDPQYINGAPVTVRPFGPDALVVVGNRVVLTAPPADTHGAVTTAQLAQTWAVRLAQGLTQSRQGSAVFTLM
jgi:hypothetical protein